LQEISLVNGYEVTLVQNPTRHGETVLVSSRHRDL